MNCYECAKDGIASAAVGVCGHCGAAMCLEHAQEAARYTVAGTRYGCPHDFAVPARAVRGMAAGLAATSRNGHKRLPVGAAR
jgi:hypothetical protein